MDKAAREKARETESDSSSATATYPTPAHGWTCFHCGEHFAPNLLGQSRARDHFGCKPTAIPACRIKGDDERALLMAFRRGEFELEICRVEDLHKQNRINDLRGTNARLRARVSELEAALANEREECAKIAEFYADDSVAERIRSRLPAPPVGDR